MNQVYLQYWIESNREPFGCSLHINRINHQEYLNRTKNNFESVIGGLYLAEVKVDLYELVLRNKNVRLMRNQTVNLFKLSEIKIL